MNPATSEASPTQFGGIWPALITPFRNGEVDHDALRRLVLRFRDAGVAGLVVCGTTGEPATLSAAEKLAVLDTVVACESGLPLIVGVSGIDPRLVLAELDAAGQRPIAGVLVPPPYYVRPTQAAIARFYADIATASNVPVVLYNIPSRTGVRIELATIRDIAQHPNVAAIKDCAGDTALTMALIADARLAVLAGDDLQIFGTLCLGGAGAIAASAHLRPDLLVKMARHVAGGELACARDIFYALRPAMEMLFAEPNPAPVKAALAALGLIEDGVRAPLLDVTPGLRAQVTVEVKRLEELAR
jgi:4-hydroxy-tetrahydrodipicolinate synthase